MAKPIISAPVRTSHNSYSGNARKSLHEQFDDGVRCIELDIHPPNWVSDRDFVLGHMGPREEVMIGSGNPATYDLGAWLECVVAWTRKNPNHSPIIIVIDSLYALSVDKESDLSALNDTLLRILGDRVLRADDPPAANLKGRILCVLSGNSANRLRYAGVNGFHPALGVNVHGQVVMVHSTIGGGIDCWAGTLSDKGRLDWRHHSSPVMPDQACDNAVIAISDDGWIVAAYADNDRNMSVMATQIKPDGRVSWTMEVGVGVSGIPLAMDIKDRAVTLHFSDGAPKAVQFDGTLNTVKRRVQWNTSSRVTPPAPENAFTWNGLQVQCLPDASGRLACSVNGVSSFVRPTPVMFLERQDKENHPFLADARFFAVGLADKPESFAYANAVAKTEMALGRAVRLYYFTEMASKHISEPVAFPATDAPFAPWYHGYVKP